jgi:uncharacterized protein with von Willebrand factor type A (vWA) domain
MDERLVTFIRAMRGRDVRISLAESIDALRALEISGITDRTVVQAALRSTLVKDAADVPVFDELFPQFFGVDEPPPCNKRAVAYPMTPLSNSRKCSNSSSTT